MGNVYDQVMTALYSVWRKRWYGLAAMWAVCLVGWLIVAMIPNQYESSARIYAKWNSLLPRELGIGMGDQARQVQVVRDTLTSRPNLEKVIRRTGLDRQVENDGDLDALITQLAESIKVAQQEGNLFTLAYTSSNSSLDDAQNAAMAQRVVQNLINIFVEENISSNRDDSQQAIRFLEDQLAERGRELEEAERRRAEFEVKYLGRLPGQGSIASRLMSAQMEVDRIDQQLMDARTALGSLSAQLASTPATLPTASAGYAPGSAQAQVAALERQIAEGLTRGWTEQHPDMVSARQQIARLQREAKNEPAARGGAMTNPAYTSLRALIADRQGAISSLSARRAQIEAAIANVQNLQIEQPAAASEMAQVNREYDTLRRQYNELVKSREEVRLRMDVENKTDQVSFQIIDPPGMPRQPVAPNRPLLLTMVLISGLAAGLATAFLVSRIHTTYVSANDLQAAFDAPVLGSVSEVVSDQQRAQNRLWARGFAALSVGLVGAYAVLMLYQMSMQSAA